MKSFIIFFALLIATNSCYSQQMNPSPALTKQDYLKKSKNQKTSAWVFLAGGGGLIIIGAHNTDNGDGNSDQTLRTVAIVTGIAALGISTTLFIKATENKKKGELMSFKMEKAPVMQQGGLVYSSFPALSFRIRL